MSAPKSFRTPTLVLPRVGCATITLLFDDGVSHTHMQRSLVLISLLLVATAAVAVGPLGAGASQPTVTERANVTVESLPDDTITLERGRFGSGRYHIDAPPAVVSVENVAGTPILRYVIDVPGLWLTATSRYGLGGRDGRLEMRASPVTVSPDSIDRDRYEATVAVWVRTGTYERDIVQRHVVVEVSS